MIFSTWEVYQKLCRKVVSRVLQHNNILDHLPKIQEQL